MARPKKAQVSAEVTETTQTVQEVKANEPVQESLPVKVAHGEQGSKVSIHEIMRMRMAGDYPTENVDEYSQALARMNLSDLQTHAVSRGIRPTGDRRRIETTLIKEFQRSIAKRVENRNRERKNLPTVEQMEKLKHSSERMNSWFRKMV